MSESSVLAPVLDEFCGAFHAQDAVRLRAIFADDEVSFIASEAIVLHDRLELERFIDVYTAQPSVGAESTGRDTGFSRKSCVPGVEQLAVPDLPE